MKLASPGAPHLTYCTNIHAGERWAEVRANVERHVVAVKARLAPDRPFGVGLRLGGAAARELTVPAELASFQELLEQHGLYVFTINGFPHGAFHGTRVKESVYLPDWLDDERLVYSDGLARLLAALLPDGDPTLVGSVSTVPGAFKPRVGSIDDARAMAERLVRHVALLHRLREDTGKTITLALEPEPCCYLETVAETVEFFTRHVYTARVPGLGASESEACLRRHLGVCLDACHLAVEFEEPGAALQALAAAAIPIHKLQISAGLAVSLSGDPAELDALGAFAEDVYLHQVVEQNASGLVRWVDLPEAIACARRTPRPREWRIHFHVPLHRERLGRFRSTQPDLAALLALVRAAPPTRHLEVETYTWDVLPPEHREADVASEIVRELRWVVDALEGPSGGAPEGRPSA